MTPTKKKHVTPTRKKQVTPTKKKPVTPTRKKELFVNVDEVAVQGSTTPRKTWAVAELCLLVLGWYYSSSYAVSTSLPLARKINPMALTLFQLLVSTPCIYAVLVVTRATEDIDLGRAATKGRNASPRGFLLSRHRLNADLWIISASFTMGFVALTTSYLFMDAAMCLTLRGAVAACTHTENAHTHTQHTTHTGAPRGPARLARGL